MQEPFSFGILFVHGIGEQPKGETLLTTADPLIRWIRRWLRGRAVVVFRDARLNLSSRGQDEPAHATVSITPQKDQAIPAQRWMVAESWWGAEVRRPEFYELAGWMLTTGAWMIVSHFIRPGGGGRVRDTVSRVLRLLFAALPLVILSQVLVAALATLALLPIPKLRAALSGVLLKLTGVVGDTYVFVENKLQQAAIIAEVRRHLAWLGSQCGRIAVVAHSQGAAVAHRAFKSANLPNATLLITYGSGISKLEEIEWISERDPDSFREAYLSVPLSAISAFCAARLLWYYWSDPWASRGLFWVVAAWMSLLVVLSKAWRSREALQQHMRSLALPTHARWCDIFATGDPVPNGPIQGVPRIKTVRVTNLRSWLSDHTTYWKNTSEFVPEVAKRILVKAGFGNLLTKELCARVRAAGRTHRNCVAWLVFIRYATFAAFALTPLAFAGKLAAIGEQLHRALLRSPLQGAVKTIEELGGMTANPTAASTSTASSMVKTEMTLLGVILFVLLVAGWHWAYQIVWRWWDNRAGESVFQASEPSKPFLRAMVNALVVTIGLIPLLLAGIMFFRPGWVEAPGAELRLYRLAGGAFLGLVVLMFAVAIGQLAAEIGRSLWQKISEP